MPTLHTVPVTCKAFDQNGNPVVDGRFVAKLNTPEIYQGFVVPEEAEAYTDSTGTCVLNLWPNALGVAGSGYLMKAWNPDTGKLFLNGLAVVPNQACNLESILSLAPYPEIDASQQAMIASQAVLATVTSMVAGATASQEAAAASEAAAEADRLAALASQAAAANSAAEAAYSAGRIDLGDLDTAVAATIANAQLTADGVVTSTTLAGIATTMRDQAVAAETGADAARDDAVLQAAAALASETAAAASEAAAAVSAAAALASETAAASSELAAETAEIAAETAQSAAEAANTAAQAAAVVSENEATASAASAAAALVSQNAAAASATAADTSADAADVSEANALAQATAAAASATAAGASEDAAAASAVTAAAQAAASDASATTAAGHVAAAGVARTAAELAETNAETAEANAEAAAATATAQATAAGVARDAAEAAEAAAEASASTAYAAATGGAGGVLSGAYPNPGFAVDMATQAELNTLAATVSNVDNTSDANKPVSTAQAAADALKASLTGAVFSGPVTVPALLGVHLGVYRNKLINGDWSQNARSLTSVADDTYFLDRWYILTETDNVTVAQLLDAESGAPFGVRLTQPDASPKRVGFAQIIESKNIRQYASQAMNLSARLRLSTGANIRYAVIEHTGTADVVTSDVVNNWASASFTPSNFFIAGVNIISTGTITPGAATWGEVSDWDALGATVKNVIVFVWTESQVAQNVTLDCSRIQYEPGVVATPHEWRLIEDVLCSRYVYPLGSSRPKGQAASASAATSIEVYTPAPMRATPAISVGSHNFSAAGGGQVGPFTVVVTSVNRNAVRLDASGGTGLVAGDVTVMVPAAGTFLSAEL